MSNICKTELRSIVQETANRITSCDSTEDILFSVKSVDDALWKDGSPRITKIDINNLPIASDFSNGHVVYLEDAKIPVISSNGVWITVDGRTLNVNNENQIFVWGDGTGGELGTGDVLNRCSPVREISSSTNWCKISVSGFQTAMKTDNSIWSWGYNGGRLGDGTTVDRCSPVREISSSTNWCINSAGGFHATAIKSDGTLWAWGCGSEGRLGNGTTSNTCSPVREISSSTNWLLVGNSRFTSAAIKSDGSLWSWGGGINGLLGTGNSSNVCSPVREICSSLNWCFVSGGRFHVSAIKTDGSLWAWGNNYCGQLGDGRKFNVSSPRREFCSATNWCFVSSGNYHSSAIKTDGSLWSWGQGVAGSLGNGSAVNASCSPVREISSSTNWNLTSSGSIFTNAIKTDGSLWSWGCNFCGRLGNGTVTDSCSPIREFSSSTDWCDVSSFFSIAAIKSTQTLCR